ncbi:VP11 [Thermus phage P23-77]|uniref:VP11 n=1 Tax=Thermus virus P23-77 TaxID=1714272 RepID=C8CHK9_9VIRU|nr:VP11 [Thermus phage P23-77]ACV05038.1 VP11 [Thermus phage P23-77]
MIRRQQICRVVYRDKRGRFIKPPEIPKKVELSPVPRPMRVNRGVGEIVAVEETPKGVKVRFVPDLETRALIREAKRNKDRKTLKQIREWQREVTRLAADDYIKAKRSGEWDRRMEKAHHAYYSSKGGQTAAANRKKVEALAEKFRKQDTTTLLTLYRRLGGSELEKRAIAQVLKERNIEVYQPKRRR